jgi:hypothetical protein
MRTLGSLSPSSWLRPRSRGGPGSTVRPMSPISRLHLMGLFQEVREDREHDLREREARLQDLRAEAGLPRSQVRLRRTQPPLQICIDVSCDSLDSLL